MRWTSPCVARFESLAVRGSSRAIRPSKGGYLRIFSCACQGCRNLAKAQSRMSRALGGSTGGSCVRQSGQTTGHLYAAALLTATVREQHPRPRRKGNRRKGRVRTGDRRVRASSPDSREPLPICSLFPSPLFSLLPFLRYSYFPFPPPCLFSPIHQSLLFSESVPPSSV